MTTQCMLPCLQLMSEEDKQGFEECLRRDNFSFIYECGFTLRIAFENRFKFLKSVWQHFTCYSVFAELSQLPEGLCGGF